MASSRLGSYRARIRGALRTALEEEHPPKEVSGSFALGTFITMLPTLGTGLVLFVVLVAIFDRISKVALLASVVVFNPVVKWGVYAASFALGVAILGPVEGVSPTTASLSAGPDIIVRLLVGNLILAVIATVISYFVVYRLAVAYRHTEVGERIEEAVHDIADELKK